MCLRELEVLHEHLLQLDKITRGREPYTDQIPEMYRETVHNLDLAMDREINREIQRMHSDMVCEYTRALSTVICTNL